MISSLLLIFELGCPLQQKVIAMRFILRLKSGIAILKFCRENNNENLCDFYLFEGI